MPDKLEDLDRQRDAIDKRLEDALIKRDDLLARSDAMTGKNVAAMLDALAKNPDAKICNVSTELDAVNQEIGILGKALRALTAKIHTAEDQSLVDRVQALIPERKKLVKEVIGHLVALSDLFRREQLTRTETYLPLHLQDAALTPWATPFTLWLGNEPSSGLSAYLRAAIEQGIIDESESVLKGRKFRYT